MYFVEYCFGFPLLAKPYKSQTFEDSTALEVRLFLEDLLSFLQGFLVVPVVKRVIDRPQPPLSHRVLCRVFGHVDSGHGENDEEISEEQGHQELV